jgi:8-oxo-dGTP diphosphatase
VGFEDRFRLSVHAVITDEHRRVLMVRATYGDRAWGLPGGALDPGETIHEALRRECREELGLEVEAVYLSGVYHHAAVESHAFIFRARLPADQAPTLSDEHSAWKYVPVGELPTVQRQRVEECLAFDGQLRSAAF